MSIENGGAAVKAPPSEELPPAEGDESGITGPSVADDVSRAPEEESQDEIPGDPRPPHAMQPPTKESY